jgi:hypothetical protein
MNRGYEGSGIVSKNIPNNTTRIIIKFGTVYSTTNLTSNYAKAEVINSSGNVLHTIDRLYGDGIVESTIELTSPSTAGTYIRLSEIGVSILTLSYILTSDYQPFTYDAQTLYEGSNSYALGTASDVYIADPGEYTYFTRTPDYAFLSNVSVGVSVEKTWVGAASTEQKIIMPDPEASALLGLSVAISGDYMIAGAILEDSGGTTDAGAAYIYRRTGINTWDTGTKVVSNNPEVSGWFGRCVSISGDYAIVGASQENVNGITDAGAAYIYRRTGTNTWDTGTKIVSNDPEASAFFGESVSISGDYVIVGAPQKNLDGNTIM